MAVAIEATMWASLSTIILYNPFGFCKVYANEFVEI